MEITKTHNKIVVFCLLKRASKIQEIRKNPQNLASDVAPVHDPMKELRHDFHDP